MNSGDSQKEKDDQFQLITGVSLAIGAVVVLVFSLVIRSVGNSDHLEEYFRMISDRSTIWTILHMFVAAGFWAMMVGAMGVNRSIVVGGAYVWSLVGFLGLGLGTAFWTARLALSGIGLPAVAEPLGWVDGVDRVIVLNTAAASYRMVFGLQIMSIIVYWIALAFIGVGMIVGKVYAVWVGWVTTGLGISTAIVGVIWASTGLSLWSVFTVLSTLTLVWAIFIGIGNAYGSIQTRAGDSIGGTS